MSVYYIYDTLNVLQLALRRLAVIPVHLADLRSSPSSGEGLQRTPCNLAKEKSPQKIHNRFQVLCISFADKTTGIIAQTAQKTAAEGRRGVV